MRHAGNLEQQRCVLEYRTRLHTLIDEIESSETLEVLWKMGCYMSLGVVPASLHPVGNLLVALVGLLGCCWVV